MLNSYYPQKLTPLSGATDECTRDHGRTLYTLLVLYAPKAKAMVLLASVDPY